MIFDRARRKLGRAVCKPLPEVAGVIRGLFGPRAALQLKVILLDEPTEDLSPILVDDVVFNKIRRTNGGSIGRRWRFDSGRV